MLGVFGFQGVSILELLTIAGLLAATSVVVWRGGGDRWAQWGAVGFGLLAVSRICGLVTTQWFLHADSPIYQRVHGLQLFTAGQWLVSSAGLVALLVAVLSQRATAGPAADLSDRGRATPEGAEPPPR